MYMFGRAQRKAEGLEAVAYEHITKAKALETAQRIAERARCRTGPQTSPTV